jgi:hypothetical protein
MSEQKRMASSQIFGLSVAMGLSLVCITLFLGWLNLHLGWNGNMLKWLVLPALGFGIALSLNSFVQQTLCGRINASQIALGSTVVLGAILLSLVLTLSSTIRSFIEVAVPPLQRARYGGMVAVAFYLFWAGMFGEAFAAGFAQSCASS